MARTKANTDNTQTEVTGAKTTAKAETAVEIPKHVDELLKHYPHLKKAWVTKEGFVHQEDSPKYLIEGAVLYDNKYYQS